MNDLISREAAIEAIRYRVCQGYGNKEHICERGSCAYCGIMEIMNDISSIPSSLDWISTKDRLPEADISVLIYANGHRVTAYYDIILQVFRLTEDDRLYYETNKVTHWQPLPEPPEKENNDE